MLNPSKLQAFVENVQYTPKPILEATFYGKNEELLRVESILDDMVELGHAGRATSAEFNDKMFEVSTVLGQLFGFSSLQINNSILCVSPELMMCFVSSTGVTVAHSCIIKYTKLATNAATGGNTEIVDFDKRHKGIRFKSNAKYAMRMFLSMELFEDRGEYSYTGGEILAIMLHEIGHNFYVGPINELGAEFISMMTAVDLVKWVTATINFIFLTDGTEVIDKMLPDSIKKDNARIANIIGALLQPTFAINRLYNICKSLLHFATVIGNIITMIPSRIIGNVLHYDSEKYSDAFAASYGYGTELSNALAKMGHMTVPYMTHKNIQIIFDFLLALYRIPLSFLLALMDVHPENNGRLHNNIKYMEAAGAKITDTRLKKEYDAAIAGMYELRNQTKQYIGPNPIKLNNKLAACIQDLLQLSDLKDLASGLRPTLTKYANLDYTT